MDLAKMREIRSELKQMEIEDLFNLTHRQKARWCPIGAEECSFYILHKDIGFCLTELLGQGCSPQLEPGGLSRKENPLRFSNPTGKKE